MPIPALSLFFSLAVIFITLLFTVFVVIKTGKSLLSTVYVFLFNGILSFCLLLISGSLLPLLSLPVGQSITVYSQIIYSLGVIQFILALFILSDFKFNRPAFLSFDQSVIVGINNLVLSVFTIFIFSSQDSAIIKFFSKLEIYYLIVLPPVLVLSGFLIIQLALIAKGAKNSFRLFSYLFISGITTLLLPAAFSILSLSTFSIGASLGSYLFLILFAASLLFLYKEAVSPAADLQNTASNTAVISADNIKTPMDKLKAVMKPAVQNTDEIKLMEYLVSLIPDKNKIVLEMGRIEKLKKDQSGNNGSETVSLYISLEEFLLNHNPPDITKSYTIETLRNEITSRFDLNNFPYELRVLFLPQPVSSVHAVEFGVKDLGTFILEHIGSAKIKEIVDKEGYKELTDDIEFTDKGIDFAKLNAKIEQEKDNSNFIEKVALLFKELYNRFFMTVEETYGEKTALNLVKHTFEKLDRTQNTEAVKQLYEVIPQKLKENEKVISLTPSMLEAKIRERTALLEEAKNELETKVKQIEDQNSALNKTQAEMMLLIEKQRILQEELKKEKAGVEEKVVERTRELAENTKALNIVKTRLTASLQNITLGFIMTSTGREVEFVNLSAVNIFGLKVDEPANYFEDIQNKLMPGKFDLKEKVTECITSKKMIETKNIPFNDRFLNITISPIIMEDGQTLGTVIVVRDVTEALLLERSRDEFFSIASHELRTPLTAIRGNTSMIKQYFIDKINDSTLKEMIGDIHNSSIRLIEIVNDFLNVSRLEMGRMVFKKEKIEADKVINEVIHELSTVAMEKNLTLKYEYNHPLPLYSLTDSERLKEVLVNLIGNSLKYTSTGGVTVRTESYPTNIKVMVEDSGRGIPHENISLLFRKFQQAGKSIFTRDTSKGTGLGLYISKLLVEGLGGEIWLEKTEEGKGSVFSFTLPVYREKPENVVQLKKEV